MRQLLKNYWVLFFAALLYFPFIFLGYGIDNDTYALLDNGKVAIQTGSYIPSRHPGYIVHEAATMFLSSIGGSVLSNAGTMAMTLLLIAGFMKICRYFSIPNSKYLAIILILHPLVLINSTETIDYLWALGLIFSGFSMLLDARYFYAGLLLGLSVGARLSSFIAVGGIFAYALYFAKETDIAKNRKRVLLAMLTTAIIGILCYVPSLVYANWTLAVFKPHMPDNEAWSFKSRVGKFVYKNVYFWGVPALIMVAYTLFISARNRNGFLKQPWSGLSLICLLTIIGYEILFLRFPIQVEYLIPVLPFCLFLFGIGLKKNPGTIIILAVSVFSLNIVNFNLAKANIPGKATGAKLGLWIEKGLLVNEIRWRRYFKDCNTGDCWTKKFETIEESNY